MSIKGFEIITMENCRYCRLAKSAFDARSIDYDEIPVTPELREELKAMGLKTLPQVYVITDAGAKKHIGGCDDLIAFLNEIEDEDE